MINKDLNGYTNWRFSKYKLLVISSDISAKLRENCFQTNSKFNIKIAV